MTLPRTGRLLTVRLLPWDTGVETRISVNAARIVFPPTTCTWTTNDGLRLRWRCHPLPSLVVPSLGITNNVGGGGGGG